MKTSTAITIAVLTFLVVLSTLLFAATASANEGQGQEKVTICHNTSSETNPQVEITIAVPALEAHVANHEDGEFDTEGPCPVAETTTTTVVDETTTTTQQEETTTTVAPTTTLAPTTTVTEAPTTTVQAATPVAAPEPRTELPYTGLDPTFLLGAVAALGSSGAYLLRKTRTQ